MITSKANLLLLIVILLFSICTCQQENPLIVSEQDDEQHSDQHSEQSGVLLNVSQRWGFGFLAGLGISLIGFITALVIVLCKHMASDRCFEMTIKFLFSLAFGALLGDAMIHILPAAYSDLADFRVTAGIFIGSIVFFIILERVFSACGISHKHWHGDQCHDDHEGAIEKHNHPRRVHNEDQCQLDHENSIKVQQLNSSKIVNDQIKIKKSETNREDQLNPQLNENEGDSETRIAENQSKSCWQNLKGKGAAGYLNLLGSFIHNFMDGLALGVAFATGESKVFVPMLVAIIAHEIPREMGDVAILMTNKFNSTQTVLCNGVVNLTSLVGVFIGLAISNLDQLTKNYVLVFVAGNFIFIAADIWKNLFKNKNFLGNFVEFVGFGVGITAMYLILLLQEGQQGHQH